MPRAKAKAARATRTVSLDERALSFAKSQLATVATMAFMGAGGGVLSAVMHGGPDAATMSREMVGSTIDAHAHTVKQATTRLADARDRARPRPPRREGGRRPREVRSARAARP